MFTLAGKEKEKEKDKRSFFERLTGTINLDENDEHELLEDHPVSASRPGGFATTQQTPIVTTKPSLVAPEEPEEGQLAVDVYQTEREIIVQAMVAGVSPDTLSVTATRETLTIKGRRDAPSVNDHDYFYRELYWGAFSRTLTLPQEVETDTVEASQKHGLLTIKLAKLDKTKSQSVRVKLG